MAAWSRLGLISLIFLGLWGCGPGSSVHGQAVDGQGQTVAARFTKADNGVITDRVTGLDWYVGPNSDNTWRQAQAWAEHLTVGGGGWRLPTVKELKAIYQKGAGPSNLDPVFQVQGAWVWSGESNNAWSAWGFAFYNGLEGWHHLDYANGRLALAVRVHK